MSLRKKKWKKMSVRAKFRCWRRYFWQEWKWFVVCGGIVVGACLVFARVLSWVLRDEYVGTGTVSAQATEGCSKGKEYWDVVGVFGDQFGMLNTLFSGLAFAGVIVALYAQKKELRLQREDLALQREEMVAGRKEQEEQTRVFERQVFEDAMVSLVDMMRDARNKVNLNSSNKSAFVRLERKIKAFTVERSMDMLDDIKGNLEDDKNEFKEWVSCCLMCVRRIELSGFKRNEKKIYFESFKSILKKNEIFILYFLTAIMNDSFVRIGRLICFKRNILSGEMNKHLFPVEYVDNGLTGVRNLRRKLGMRPDPKRELV